jgi:hypothetical protein
MVEVGRHGAFSVNSVGLGGAPFPLSFSVREVNGSWVVDATAAQAVELVDVLERAANDVPERVRIAVWRIEAVYVGDFHPCVKWPELTGDVPRPVRTRASRV